MAPFVDLTGFKFERLTVKRQYGYDARHKTLWLCLCTCGNYSIVTTSNLRAGSNKSCGCLKRERAIELSKTLAQQGIHAIKHSHAKQGLTPEYNSWRGMIDRCTNPNADNYRYYGGRGIKVCEKWLAFDKFLVDMGERPQPKKQYSIERQNNSGNYEPDNCYWATKKTQANNRRKREAERLIDRLEQVANRPIEEIIKMYETGTSATPIFVSED
jgi:hypothetical protein